MHTRHRLSTICRTCRCVSPFLHPFLHLLDLLALTCDDIIRELHEFWMLGSCHHLCHIDRTLMVWDHPLEERSIECISRLACHHRAHICHTHRHHIVRCIRSCGGIVLRTTHHLGHRLAVFCHLVCISSHLLGHHLAVTSISATTIITIPLTMRSDTGTKSKGSYYKTDCDPDAEGSTPVAPGARTGFWSATCSIFALAWITFAIHTGTWFIFFGYHKKKS